MCFCSTFSNSYEKWDIYSLVHGLHLCVFLWSWTYDGDPLFAQCHESIVILLHNPKDFSSPLFESFPSLNVDCDGVLGSSSSCSSVPSFYFTNVSWFASYFKIGNSYSSSSRSLSFSGHFLFVASTNEYRSTLFIPNIYFA
jgi:hypothetical protein